MNSSKSGLTIPNLLILCGSILLGTALVCGVIILVAAGGFDGIFAGNNNDETKQETISLQYEGLKFQLSPKFGETVRSLAKEHKAFNKDIMSIYDRNRAYLSSSDIDKVLDAKYSYENTELGFMNKNGLKETFEVRNEADSFVHDDNYKVSDTGTSYLSFEIVKGDTLTIDDITINCGKTTENDLLKKFKDIKVQDDTDDSMGEEYAHHEHYLLAKYKGWYIYITYEENKIDFSFKDSPNQRF